MYSGDVMVQNSEPRLDTIKADNKNTSAAVSGKGDLNNDGNINVSDISKIAAHIKGKKMLGNGKVADINNDSTVNVTDLSLLAAHIKGKKIMK